jgi:GNAT superfamily N-acetyltransferase
MRPADLVIEPLTDLEQLTELEADATADGQGMVSRLIREWRDGCNRFSAAGERVYVAKRGERVCGVCGLNRDPYARDDSIGRVRRLYVSTAERRTGIGRALIDRLMADARGVYSWIHLRAREPEAAAFYQANGFEHVVGNADYTHRRQVTEVFRRSVGSPGATDDGEPLETRLINAAEDENGRLDRAQHTREHMKEEVTRGGIAGRPMSTDL